MTPKNALYLLLAVVMLFLVIKGLLFLFQDRSPKPKVVTYYPAQFPICQGSLETEGIKNIQRHLNANVKTYIMPLLEIDGKFGGLTEYQLKDQTGSICVSNAMYPGMV